MVCGPTFLDVVMASLPHEPQLGQEIWVDHSRICAGGAGNQATALAKLGVECQLSTCLGEDLAGVTVQKTLEKAHVGLQYAERIDQQPVTVSLAWAGDRAMVTAGALTVASLPPELPVVPRILIANLQTLSENEETVKTWRKKGTIVIGNVGWDDSNQWDLTDLAPLTYCDYFIPNELEITHYGKNSQLANAIEYIRSNTHTEATFVITQGAQGVTIAEKNSPAWSMPALRVSVLDPTGAGDVFTAGFATGILFSRSLRESVSFALFLASLSLSQPGGAGAAPTAQEIVNLLTTAQLPSTYALDWVKNLPHNR